jgi:hypothetical protein
VAKLAADLVDLINLKQIPFCEAKQKNYNNLLLPLGSAPGFFFINEPSSECWNGRPLPPAACRLPPAACRAGKTPLLF